MLIETRLMLGNSISQKGICKSVPNILPGNGVVITMIGTASSVLSCPSVRRVRFLEVQRCQSWRP